MIKNIPKRYNNNRYLFKRLFKEHISLQLPKLAIAVFCMILIAVTTAISAWLMKPVLDKIFVEKQVYMLYVIPAALLLNSIVKGVAYFLQTTTMKIVGQKIVTDIQLRLYSHLIYSDMGFLTEYPSGNLISRFTNDINTMKKSVSDVVTGIAQEAFTLVGLVFIMFYQSFNLAVIATLVIPLAFYPITRLGKRMRKIAKGIQEELGDFTVRLDETFQNIRIIKSYCREEYEISRARAIIERFLNLFRKAAYVESASSPIMETLGGIAVALVVLYGGSEVIAGKTTPGAFFSFVTALLMAYKPLKTITQLNNTLQEGMAACSRLFQMLDERPTIVDSKKSYSLPDARKDIRFQDICFAYKSGTKILENLNMTIPQGKTIALVGGSGVGKTTILNLLQRLYEPSSGNILIGEHNIADVRLKSLRDSIALVSQEVALFDDTILENIRYGRLDATEEEVQDAALAAAAHEFIVKLPNGYKTQVGQHGVRLSGGQRQRLAIARAILKNAPILLLDEATSALDTISEKQVQLALDYLKQGRTTIVIAHRLSTIESADIIYVISEGKVLEFGEHEKLLTMGGEYTKLYEQYKVKNIVS